VDGAGEHHLKHLSQAQKAKIACSSSYVDYRPKTNELILLDTGHTKERSHGMGRAREGNQVVECG
jgi:hypothetical protein